MNGTPDIRALAGPGESLEYCVERYLSGELSPCETTAFERELVQPELAGVFREILLVRELLRSAPPHGVPGGLNDRIARALEIEMTGDIEPAHASESVLARRTRIARNGFAWIYRGPSLAFAGTPGAGSSGSDTGSLEASARRPEPASCEVGSAPGPKVTASVRARFRGERGRRWTLRAISTSARATGRIGAWALRRAFESAHPEPSLLARLRGST